MVTDTVAATFAGLPADARVLLEEAQQEASRIEGMLLRPASCLRVADTVATRLQVNHGPSNSLILLHFLLLQNRRIHPVVFMSIFAFRTLFSAANQLRESTNNPCL